MPAGDVKILEEIVNSVSAITDNFIILSVHDDVDL